MKRMAAYLTLGLVLVSFNALATGQSMHRSKPMESTKISEPKDKVKPLPSNFKDEMHELNQTLTDMNNNINNVQISQDFNFSISAIQGANFRVSF
ncbi:hypothetical protein K1X76_04700 [bacterium]|nr:hypothetical protein [bacterium]